MSLTKQYGFIHQTMIVILVSMIRISYLSKFGKFGRCQTGKVLFTNELVVAISSQTQKKKKKRKKRVIEIFGVNDMDMLHFKVWKVLLYYYLMPEILGTHKKSQMINHNLPRKIAIIKVITFYMATC